MKEPRSRIFDKNRHEPISPFCAFEYPEMMNMEACFAKELIHAHGMISAVPTEQKTYYQAARMLTPQEVVTRACDIAEATFAEFEKRGWLIEVPSYDEMLEKLETNGQYTPVGFGDRK